MRIMMVFPSLLLVSLLVGPLGSFAFTAQSTFIHQQHNHHVPTPKTTTTSTVIRQPFRVALFAQTDDDDDDEDDTENEEKVNPYADPNYPQLEFIDYSDPEYKVDQGLGDELFPTEVNNNSVSAQQTSTETELESMREDRRKRNDEFQFQTFYANILKNGATFKGEWTLYKTSTFLNTAEKQQQEQQLQIPSLHKAAQTFLVESNGSKMLLEEDEIGSIKSGEGAPNNFPVEQERIVHKERLVTQDYVTRQYEEWKSSDSSSSSSTTSTTTSDEKDDTPSEPNAVETELMNTPYWPREPLCFTDFRGAQGIMCVSNAYTISSAVSLDGQRPTSTQDTLGPFSEYRAEVGLTTDDLRFRIKLDYAIVPSKDESTTNTPPPLHLRSFVVCREMRGLWPRATAGDAQSCDFDNPQMTSINEALFGIPGADNGLYDPPPVGTDEQAAQYLQLDLDGHATALFPYMMDQMSVNNDDDALGWVMSLDWTPGSMRYQVDRKVTGGKKLLGLRTLELSEVQSADAETYRPRDGGRNMRQ